MTASISGVCQQVFAGVVPPRAATLRRNRHRRTWPFFLTAACHMIR
jgi:hypothetical protein